jgi:hypothetical protein
MIGAGGGGAGEGEVAPVDFSGEVTFFFGSRDFPGSGRMGGAEEEGDGGAVQVDFDIMDSLEMGAVEGIGEAQEGGEVTDPELIGGGEGFEFGMFIGRKGFAVVAGDLGKPFHLGRG